MISAILVILAAIANSIGDKIQFHWSTSIFSARGWDSWANPQISWKRKWKWENEKLDHTRAEAFPGSSTIFVSFTDLWHFVKSIQLTTLFLACVLWSPVINPESWILGTLINFAFLRIIYGVTFELFNSRILAKK